MEILRTMRAYKTAYRCQCKICDTKVQVDKQDLHYAGGLRLYWVCPVCCFDQFESIFKIGSKKVIFYKNVEKSED